MNLRTKVLLPLVFFGAILTGYLYGYWMPQSLERLRIEHQDATERHLDSVIEGLIPLLLGRQLDTIYENLDALRAKNREWVGIELDDAQGKSLYPLSDVPEPAAKAAAGDTQLLKRRIDYLGKNLGILAVSVDFGPWLAQAEDRQRELVAVVLIVIVAFFASAAFILERVVVRPVNALSEAASDLARNRFDRQLEKSGNDEVGNLVDRFVEMREAIRGYQAELLQRSEVLKGSQEGLAEAQRMAHLGNWELDPTTNRLVWSDEIYRIFGLDPQQHEASAMPLLAAIHPGDRERVTATYARRGLDGVPYDLVYQIVRASDQEIRYVREICEPVRGEGGMLLRLRGTLHDITEMKRAEEEIHQLNQELERRVIERTARLEAANRELETFSYSVSHDLRAPLRHIDGFLGLLKRKLGPTLDDESRHYVATISEAALRMAALIDDLLTFSRMGRAAMIRTELDLGDLVQEVVREFETETKDRVIDWRIAEFPVVTGDRAMLRVALVNLISNALKFTQPRERTEIEIGWLPDQAMETVVFVRDNGVGFDMKYVDKLFGVFQRLHGVDEFEGTGIGLANVRRVIERHGGRTWAEGKVDGGATFFFSLPQSGGKDTEGDRQ
jgi:signal transduction histidine kinase